MDKRTVFPVVGIVLVLVGFFSWGLFLHQQKSYDIALKSDVQGVMLTWKDESILQNVLKERLGIRGALDPSTLRFSPVKRVVITLTSEKQSSLITYAGQPEEGNHIASVNYSVGGDILFIAIYLQFPPLASLPATIQRQRSILTDAVFNEKLVQLLISATPDRERQNAIADKAKPGQWVTDAEREDIMTRFFHVIGNNRLVGTYPIHIVKK